MIGLKHTKGMIKRLCDLSVNSFLRSLREIQTFGKQRNTKL